MRSQSARNLPLLATSKRPARQESSAALWISCGALLLVLTYAGWHLLYGGRPHGLDGFPSMPSQINLTRNQQAEAAQMAAAGRGQWQLQQGEGLVRRKSTLIVYAAGPGGDNDGPSAIELANFDYFVQHGIQVDSCCKYLLLMHKTWSPAAEVMLAKLPSNDDRIQTVSHEAACGGWGLLGWAADSGHFQYDLQDYIVLVTPAMRGPFVPPYFELANMHWSEAFTLKLKGSTKLVAPLITCEPAISLQAPMRHNPHPVPTMAAMDKAGFKMLYERGSSLKCYQAPLEAVYHGDAGAALQMLHAGYNMESLLARYKGVDFRRTDNWECNKGLSPHGPRYYDGMDVHPFETIFIPLDQRSLDIRAPSAIMAYKLTLWNALAPAKRNVTENEQVQYEGVYHEMQKAVVQYTDKRCFDMAYYRRNNQDLQGYDDDFLWNQWLSHGQFEARKWKFFCHRYISTPVQK